MVNRQKCFISFPESKAASAMRANPGRESIDKGIRQDKKICPDCGVQMVRLGSCFSCPACGYGGCS
jgi:hypothetical protein